MSGQIVRGPAAGKRYKSEKKRPRVLKLPVMKQKHSEQKMKNNFPVVCNLHMPDISLRGERIDEEREMVATFRRCTDNEGGCRFSDHSFASTSFIWVILFGSHRTPELHTLEKTKELVLDIHQRIIRLPDGKNLRQCHVAS